MMPARRSPGVRMLLAASVFTVANVPFLRRQQYSLRSI
jgi:hypothetical protein